MMTRTGKQRLARAKEKPDVDGAHVREEADCVDNERVGGAGGVGQIKSVFDRLLFESDEEVFTIRRRERVWCLCVCKREMDQVVPVDCCGVVDLRRGVAVLMIQLQKTMSSLVERLRVRSIGCFERFVVDWCLMD
ncbi:hypothetical protein Droror1_Dr00008706 [Drosera rotundifolia]